MSKKIVVTFLVLVLLIAGVGMGVYLVRQQQDIREKAAPATSLTILPSDSNPQVNDNFTTAVNINTSENQVVGVAMYINFDPNVLEVLEVAPGTFFNSPNEVGPQINNNAGTLSYTLLLSPGNQAQTGTGTLANISFRAKSTGTSSVSLANETIVVAVGEEGENVLQTAVPANITVSSSQTAQQPTAVPTTQQSTNSSNNQQNLTSSPTPTNTTTSGVGGGASSPTPTKAAISTLTPSPTTSSTNPAVSKGDTELPDSGVPLPTLLMTGSFILLMFGVLLLAF